MELYARTCSKHSLIDEPLGSQIVLGFLQKDVLLTND